MSSKRFLFFSLLLLILFAIGIFFPCVGQTFYPFGTEIYWLRFYRTALALIAGGGLALAGLVFQTMFRNPLATPYTLGVASGAAFGATLCLQTSLHFGLPRLLGAVPTVSLGSFFGASLAMGIVLVLSRYRNTSTEQILLAGVAVNFFFSSLIVLLQYTSSPYDALKILHWTMGGVHNACREDVCRLVPVILLLTLFLSAQSRTMDVFVTGDDRAKSLGVNVDRFRTMLFIVTSLAVGWIVSFVGPIGFVGLIVPHITRLLLGQRHSLLILSTAFFGAIFLALCDVLIRLIFHPTELPTGILTSLLGGPFFLWLLIKKR